MKQKNLVTIILFLTLQGFINAQSAAQDKPQDLIIKIHIPINKSQFYYVRYKDTKPDDVPQEIYDALFEIQLEVVNNFTYDFAVKNGQKKYQYMYTKEDFYKYGKGVCDNYADFFIILAKEKDLTENMFKVSGGNHAWLEYRTENNIYIIDPTWSDDYPFTKGNTKELFRATPAYGKRAFFITYPESIIIFGSSKNHNIFKKRFSETALWNKDEQDNDGEEN